MKKAIAICMLSCLGFLFTACNKEEGIYTPSKKIQKIITYSSDVDDGSEPGEYENWTWNDNNTLAKIDYFENHELYYSCLFNYDGKQMIGINIPEFNTYVHFKYEGKQLAESNLYEKGDLLMTTYYTHKDGKVRHIELKDYKTSIDAKLLQWLLPIPRTIQEKFVALLKEEMAQNRTKNQYTVTMDLTWKKNNVSKITYTSNSASDNNTLVFEFTYDDFKNPFYNLFSTTFEPTSAPDTYSKNNMLTCKYSRDGNVFLTEEYTYIYKGKYPVTCALAHTEHPSYQKYIYNK